MAKNPMERLILAPIIIRERMSRPKRSDPNQNVRLCHTLSTIFAESLASIPAPGFAVGLFFSGMFIIRFFIEFIKESQGGLEEFLPFFSTGQWLSIPLILLGGYLMFKKRKIA